MLPSTRPLVAVLSGNASVDASRVDTASLRLGPNGAAPASVRRRKGTGGTELVLEFRLADTGIRPGDLNACLRGREDDGIPFEGCDLLKKPPP